MNIAAITVAGVFLLLVFLALRTLYRKVRDFWKEFWRGWDQGF